MMIATLLSLAAVSAPVVITSDTIELTGAGRLDFEADPGAFALDPPIEGDRRAFTVTLWLDAAGKPITCDPAVASRTAAAETACGQLMAKARFTLEPGFGASFRRGFVDVRFSAMRPTAGAKLEVFAWPYPRYVNTAISYPADDTPADHRLAPGDGRVDLRILVDDFPPIAMRYELESRSAMLLGVDRAGKVRTCRPLTRGEGPNTAFLDNYSCERALRRGVFVFAPDVPPFEGLRYTRTTISWLLPRG